MVQVWLKQNYDTEKNGLPTWRKLVEAVDKLGECALAKDIAAEHPKGKNPFPYSTCVRS